MMNELEKKIGQRLRDAESSGGVDANELWANIAGQLEEEPPRGAIFRWYVFLIPLLMLSVGALVWQLKPPVTFAERGAGMPDQTDRLSTEPEDAKLPEDVAVFDSRTTENNNSTEVKTSVNSEPPTTFSKVQKSTESTDMSKKVEASEKLREKANSSLDLASSIEDERVVSPTEKVTLAPPIILPQKSRDDNEFSEAIMIDRVEIVPRIPGQTLIIKTNEKFKSLKERRFELGLFAGSTMVLPNFTTEETEARQRAELLNDGYRAEPRPTVALELNYRLTDHFKISSGLQLSRFTEEFNYFNERDTSVAVINGADTTTRNAVLARTVRHHNRHTALSVPFLLVYERAIGRLNYGLGAGVGLNFIRSQRGKTLNAASRITTFDSALDQSMLPRPTFNLSYLLQGRFDYRLNGNWNVGLRANLSYADYGYREFYDLRLSTLNLGVNVGLNYRF